MLVSNLCFGTQNCFFHSLNQSWSNASLQCWFLLVSFYKFVGGGRVMWKKSAMLLRHTKAICGDGGGGWTTENIPPHYSSQGCISSFQSSLRRHHRERCGSVSVADSRLFGGWRWREITFWILLHRMSGAFFYVCFCFKGILPYLNYPFFYYHAQIFLFP